MYLSVSPNSCFRKRKKLWAKVQQMPCIKGSEQQEQNMVTVKFQPLPNGNSVTPAPASNTPNNTESTPLSNSHAAT